MDILDVSITIKEFQEEWLLKFTPNDFKYWLPRLDSELPSEKACAVGMFEAWGKNGVLKDYARWLQLREDSVKIQEKYDKAAKERSKRVEDEREDIRFFTKHYSDSYYDYRMKSLYDWVNPHQQAKDASEMEWADWYTEYIGVPNA